MEESIGAQYALQIALQTMKERCKQLQQRNIVLEEENVNLRSKCLDDSSLNDLSEVDVLKEKVAQLSEQKTQLMQNVLMVSTENRHLWNRLSKLTQANETLGGHLNKIKDTLKQHNNSTSSSMHQSAHAPLIRSKTFTQETPANKIIPKIETDFDNLSMEDISLKLISSIAKEKSELEKQCSQMIELQNDDTFFSPMGFAYPEDVEDSVMEEFSQHVNDLKSIKELLVQQNAKLQKELINMKVILTEQSNRICKECVRKSRLEKIEEIKQISSLSHWGAPQTPTISNNTTMVITSEPANKTSTTITVMNSPEQIEVDKICPMCSKSFLKNVQFTEFQQHVESHFISEDCMNSIDNYEFL